MVLKSHSNKQDFHRDQMQKRAEWKDGGWLLKIRFQHHYTQALTLGGMHERQVAQLL